MNTKKALNIIIVLLLIINLFMLGFILLSSNGILEDSEQGEYAKEILSYRGIQLKTTIEDDLDVEKNKVSFKKGVFNEDFVENVRTVTGGTVTSKAEESLLTYTNTNEDNDSYYIGDRFEADRMIRTFLDDIGFNHINYVVDTVVMSSRNTYHITYIYIINGEVLYDLYIDATIDEYGISKVEIKYIENEVDKTKKIKVLPIANVLLGNITFNESGSNVIERIDTGYKLDENNTLAYVVRVTYEDKNIVFFNRDN